MEKKQKEARGEISANVKKYRLLEGMTQEQVSELLFMDANYYAQIERGERNFSIDKLVKLCSIFNVGIDKLVEVEHKQGDPELINMIIDQLKNLDDHQLNLVYRFITRVLLFEG